MTTRYAQEDTPTVFIVDDDPATRDSIRFLLDSAGVKAEVFASGEAFLAAYQSERPGCLILDVRLPGISGMALQDELARRGVLLPVIMLTGYSDVGLAVRAFRQGAFDFIEKPFADEQLLSCIERAVAADLDRRGRERARAAASARVERLTRREREVMLKVVEGKANKVVAYELGISQKTVESHRARVMVKLGAQSIADLVRLDWIAFGGSVPA